MSALRDLAAALRDDPVATVLEVGTVVAALGLFVWTAAALSGGPPTGRGDRYLAVVAVGTALVVLWTVVVPLYERRYR